MSMNNTPAGERVHIGFFGRRNAGKSSIVNAVTGQDLAVVSDVKGTTTDPVSKAMELLPLGPVMIIDTPGFDDVGQLGQKRVEKTRKILNKTDIAILVVDATEGLAACDRQLLELFAAKQIPHLIVYNKSDLLAQIPEDTQQTIYVSARNGDKITELKEKMAQLKQEKNDLCLIRDKLTPGDFAVLVVPIDKAAPKGRLILPQQQTIRDILDAGAISIVAKESELPQTLAALGKDPAMVITDSQVFGSVSAMVPSHIPLTSFSILMARYKGLLEDAIRGAVAVENLQDGDTVLIAEGCTHHRQCEDIGTVKIPKWLTKYTGKNIRFQFCSGTEFLDNLQEYAMVIHCGGCMLNEREVRYRTKCAVDQGIPITNYGTLIAYLNGILKRSTELFPEYYES